MTRSDKQPIPWAAVAFILIAGFTLGAMLFKLWRGV